MTCHWAKRPNILLQIERGGKWEMGNREKREEKNKWEKLLHYTGEVNHSMCWRSHNGIYIRTYGHTGACMNTICLVPLCITAFFSHSLCFTYAIVVRHTHTLTRASKDRWDPGMRKAERPDQCWALVINFNWRKGAAEHRNIMTFLPCLHTLLANKTHSHNIIPARGVHIKSTFS